MSGEPGGSESAKAEAAKTIAPHVKITLPQEVHPDQCAKAKSVHKLEPFDLLENEWEFGSAARLVTLFEANPKQVPFDLAFALSRSKRAFASLNEPELVGNSAGNATGRRTRVEQCKALNAR